MESKEIVIQPMAVAKHRAFNKEYAKSILENLEFIRVTSFSVFEQCPYTWAFKYLGQGEQEASKAAKIGTSVHTVVENCIKYMDGQEACADTVTNALLKVPESELAALQDYIVALAEMCAGHKLIALEHQFNFNMPNVKPFIRGHIDAVFENEDGDIIIIDHKTNRSFDSRAWWRRQLQPLLYAWAVRKLYPARRVFFCIGYVNLGRMVMWETDPDDDIALEKRIAKNWQDMLDYADAGFWPQWSNDNCRYCQVKETCSVHVPALVNLRETFLQKVSMKSPAEKLKWLQSVVGVAEELMEDLKNFIIEEAMKNDGSIDYDGLTCSISYSERRKISASDVFKLLNDFDVIDDETLDNVFTAKVTALDKIGVKHPELKKLLSERTSKVKSDKPTLKISGVQPRNQVLSIEE